MTTTQTSAQEALARIAADLVTLRELTEQPIAPAVPDRASSKLMLTVEDAAERLSISRSAIFNLLRAGELGSVRVGSRRRVPVVSLEQYVQRLVGTQGAP